MTRFESLEAFVRRSGWDGPPITPLAGDASNRRYFRAAAVADLPAAVVMDAPPEKGEDVRPFIQVTDILRGIDLSAPAILNADPEHGFLILEDLGDDLFARVLERHPGKEEELYAAAVDLLARLHAGTGNAQSLPPYDAEVYLRESSLLTEWYLPAANGVAMPADLDRDFRRIIGDLTTMLDLALPVCVLRDYHAENLLWLPDRIGLSRVGLLDYQDALAGHPAYDLVSLLEDARRDLSPGTAEKMVERYLQATRAEPVSFRRDYAILGAQRNLKIIGIFARLWLRDGKPQYLDLIPRVWDHLQTDLSHPALAPMADWVRAHVPAPSPDVLARLRTAA